jgi:hypothetical protein
MDYEKIADALMALNNASPRLPRKDQIIDVLKAASVPAIGPDGPPILVSGCALGASIVVTEDSRIALNGWHVGVKQGHQATGCDITVAVLDFLREALLLKRAQPADKLH